MALKTDSHARRETGTLTAIAPAKINLALHVTGQRSDGYHLLETLCVFSDFGDQLSVNLSNEDNFEVVGPFSGAPGIGTSNLVTMARDALRQTFSGRTCPPVSIRLEKNLPVASGIGGGSSDAAVTLKLLRAIWRLDVPDRELAGIGLTLGADVPMCLTARPLIARGIGDELAEISRFPPLHLVLVSPGVAVETSKVFSRLACRKNSPLSPLPRELSGDAIARWLVETRNDLESAATALAPQITEAVGLLQAAGAKFARMSGSGATTFGIFPSAEVAFEAAEAIAMQRPRWFVKAGKSGGATNR